MKNQNIAKIIKAAAAAMVLGFFVNSSAMAHETICSSTDNVVAISAMSYDELKTMLSNFKEKVQKSTKDDASALYSEAKNIKDAINAASLTEEQKQELQKSFNDIIELCKALK